MDEGAIRSDVERARELSLALTPERFTAMAEARRAGVTTWRAADPYSVPQRPEPYLAIIERPRRGMARRRHRQRRHRAASAPCEHRLLDGGAIQFRIPDDALAVRDWSQIWAEGDSA